MSNPRVFGLLFLVIGVLSFLGTTSDALPPAAFWAGLVTYPIGGYLFFKGSRSAILEAEARTARKLNPRIRNETLESYARQQEVRRQAPPSLAADAPDPIALDRADESAAAELVLTDLDSDRDADREEERHAAAKEDAPGLGVSTDVSFPVELQQRSNLADQLEKLKRLHEDGIIDDEEFAVAKSKLLR